MQFISKSDFKAHALEVLRDIEESGNPRIITDRGRPTHILTHKYLIDTGYMFQII